MHTSSWGHDGISRNKLHFVPRRRASLPGNRSFELLIRSFLFELENGTIVRLSRLFVTLGSVFSSQCPRRGGLWPSRDRPGLTDARGRGLAEDPLRPRTGFQ